MPFYGLLLLLVIVAYAIMLATVPIPLLSSSMAIGVQFSILVLYMVPAFLFVCTLSHLFKRALTLSAYICVFMTGAIPALVMEQLVHLPSAFTAAHIAFAMISPIYIPFGLTLVLGQGQDNHEGVSSLRIYILYIACIVGCLWGIALWYCDNYINGHWVLQVNLFSTILILSNTYQNILGEKEEEKCHRCYRRWW